jgi:tellurite resistance protein TerC
MRAIFILAGITLIERFDCVIYVLGGFLVVTGIRTGMEHEQDLEPERNPVLRILRRFLPVSDRFHGTRFLLKEGARWVATPLLIVLIVVETTDVVFALDSIPAVLAITTDPFLVYSSNVFAILGLRALYFALAGVMDRFHYLKYGIASILVGVGLKMLVSHYWEVPIAITLGTIIVILTVSIAASVLRPPQAV